MYNVLKKTLQVELQYTDFQIQQIEYVLLTLLSEISKLFVFFVFFANISKLPELMISLISLLSVRIFTGGIHLKHYISCLLLSFGILFASICILPHLINLNAFGIILILFICIITIYLIGPVPSSQRPTLSKNQKKSGSLKAAASILIYMSIILIFPDNQYLHIGFWSILLQTIQLGLAKINLYRKGENQK